MGELVLVGRLDHLVASGGGESYLHAQALAAQLAGYRTTLVTASRQGGTVVGDFGTIVRARTPIRPIRTTVAPFHMRAPVCRAGRRGATGNAKSAPFDRY